MEEMFIEIENITNTAANTIASPNWADILSAVLSFLAIIVAGVVAWKQIEIAKRQNEISKQQAEISEQQNKIALFEKRVVVSGEISKITSISNAISNSPEVPIILVYKIMLTHLGYNFDVDIKNPGHTLVNSIVIHRTLTCIKQASFLFPQISKDDTEELCDKFSAFFNDLTFEVLENPEMSIGQFANTTKLDFILACDRFNTKYNSSMVECLYLTR